MNTTSEGINPSHIEAGLAELGIRPTAHLMIHASLSRFGHVEGGAETLVSALRAAAGDDGAVIVPSFRDAIRSDHYALRECRGSCPGNLCPSRERGFTGIVGETVRSQPDALRSCHPTHSWVGVGNDSVFLLDGHGQSPTPCGTESPFFRLMQRDGIILLLGVGVSSLTNIHAVEDIRNVPYLSAIDPPHRHATYTTSGKRIQYRFAPLLQRVMSEAGILRTNRIGEADCHAIGARDLGSFLWVITHDDPWCLVLRPAGCAYDPQQDAEAKTARMLAAWRADPDHNAWTRLLEASAHQPEPIRFAPAASPRTDCPAYRGEARGYHRCAANDLPPWEKFEDFSADEPGVATCQHCNWTETSVALGGG